MPTGDELIRAGVVAGGILLVGLVALVLLRRYISRARLMFAYLLTLAVLAVYFGIGAAKPARMLDQADALTFWLVRVFVGAMLFVAVRVVDRLLIVPLMTRGGRVPIQRFIHQIIIIVIGLFTILGYGSYAFGWDIDKFLAGSAVVSIVLGLALQESLGNFFSGLVMQASSPFAIGHWIICAGVEGRVVDMNWRAVTVQTMADNFVVIPNSTIAKELITNFNAPSTATAREVLVGLEYKAEPAEAFEVLRTAATEVHGVLEDPAPRVYLNDFAESAIIYRIKFWISDASQHKWIEHEVRTRIWYRLKQAGFSIPFPIRTVEHISLRERSREASAEGMGVRVAAIQGLSLLAELSGEERAAVAAAAREVRLAPGQVLFRQGDVGDSFYVIHRGQVDVVAANAAASAPPLATLGPGQFFGEMSALTGQPRSATIRAKTPLVAVEIGKEALNNLFISNPQIMETVSQVVAERTAARAAADQAGVQKEEAVAEQQRSILSKMLTFFGRGPKR